MRKRIVSLIASSTEIIWALGYGESMVGKSHECDYPAQVKDLPQVTWTKFNTDGRSYDIDQRVKAIVQEGLSVYGVDADILERLQPDVIVTQDHCHVCAVSLADVEEAVCRMISSNPTVVSLHPDTLEDIWDDIRKVAGALDDPAAGDRLVESLQRRLDEIRTKAASATKPRVAFIEWVEPLMVGGNWAPQQIEIAGGEDVLGKVGAHSPQIPFEKLAATQPDVIIVSPCGFDIPRTLEEMPLLTQQPEWRKLPAVRNDRVYVADGNQFFNRPGPRVVESTEICAEIFHPDLFNFGHENAAWQPFGQ